VPTVACYGPISCSWVWPALQRVDRHVRRTSETLARQLPVDVANLRGLFIDAAEFAELIAQPLGAPRLPQIEPEPAGGALPEDDWQAFIAAFGLNAFEADALLVGLLAALDVRYGRVFGYLQDDIRASDPTVGLLLDLLCNNAAQRLQYRSAFLRTAPLFANHLLEYSPGSAELPLLQRAVRVEPGLAEVLLGGFERLEGYRRLSQPPLLSGSSQQMLSSIVDLPHDDGLWLHLPMPPNDARALLEALAFSWDMTLLESPADCTPAVARRDALLTRALLVIDTARLAPDADSALLREWAQTLDQAPLHVAWCGNQPEAMPWPVSDLRVAVVAPVAFSHALRMEAWQRELAGTVFAPDVDLDALSGHYRLSQAQIVQASRMARQGAWQRDPLSPRVTADDLSQAARYASRTQLGSLAHQVQSSHSWDDLILPEDTLAHLRELCNVYAYRHIVYDRWQVRQRADGGRGLSVLFAGPSGTGKTMAAQVIARQLSLDLFRINLSAIVSKYIGETEKNLEQIFESARDSNAILLFDEADALFGKRSEAHDAHDRYANIEVSYLLQKIEQYDGVVILTSNLRQNLDEAFQRRLNDVVEFPAPDIEARRRIWQRLMPPAMPLAEDVRLEELARIKLTGGSIDNVVQGAAFLAASDGGVVTREHLLWSARREFQKLGRLVEAGMFHVEANATTKGG